MLAKNTKSRSTRSTNFFGFDEFVEERRGVLVELAVELRVGRRRDARRYGRRWLQRAGRADSRHVPRARWQQHVTVRRQLRRHVDAVAHRIQQTQAAAAVAQVGLRRVTGPGRLVALRHLTLARQRHVTLACVIVIIISSVQCSVQFSTIIYVRPVAQQSYHEQSRILYLRLSSIYNQILR